MLYKTFLWLFDLSVLQNIVFLAFMDTGTFLNSNDQLGFSVIYCSYMYIFYRENGDMDYMNALVNQLSDQVSVPIIPQNPVSLERF